MNITENIIRIIKENLSRIENTVIDEDTRFEELGIDSLDVVEILMSIEDEYGIEIPEEATLSVHTVGDIAGVISELIE